MLKVTVKQDGETKCKQFGDIVFMVVVDKDDPDFKCSLLGKGNGRAALIKAAAGLHTMASQLVADEDDEFRSKFFDLLSGIVSAGELADAEEKED